MQETISITITGKVQGVFYRQSAREKALSLGITGYVQNLADKSVFIMATGNREQLDALLAWCLTGPPRARVVAVQTAGMPPQSFDSFYIKGTEGG